jgi:glycosyltransferase involved in cell wall biosynthesis
MKHLFQAGYLVHKYLPGSRVTHLHAHFAHSPTSVAMFSSQLSGLPFSFTAHAKDIYTSDSRQLREKISLARFVVTCTEHNRRYLKKISPDTATPIHRVYHGIDIGLFSDDRSEKKVAKPFKLLTVARLTPKKGLPTVYRALQCLKDRGFSFQHTLIGDGDDREVVRSLIDQLGLKPYTEWLGTQPHEVVLDHYRRANLFLLGCEIAQNGDRDGIPNVLLESMAMGVPVVATRISALPELVEDGKTGILVPPGQPEAMADAVEILLTDNELRNRVIREAREKVVQDFDNRMLIKDLSEIYKKALV